MTPEMIREVRAEVRRQINILLMGRTANATGLLEDITEMYPGMPTIQKRPIAHPFGFVSRAPDGTNSLVARRGEHPSNRIIIGHMDQNRPSLNAAGECMLYNSNGDQVYVKTGKIILAPAAGGKVALGGASPTDFVALASKVDGELTKVSTALGQLATLANAAPGPMLSAPGTVTPYVRLATGSSIVEAD